MKADELRELAERVEKATGPDRELDELIAHAAGHAQMRDGDLYAWCEAGSTNVLVRASPYTGSLDAAKSLAPDDVFVWELRRFDDGTYSCVLEVIGVRIHDVEATAATMVNAFTAASLYARASLLDTQRETM